jgi:hypothetical protein
VDPRLPQEEGVYLLCARAGGSEQVDESWTPLAQAQAIVLPIDSTPPARPPDVVVERFDDTYRVAWNYHPPEISLYRLKYGPPAETDCADPAGYETPRLDFLAVAAEEAPAALCAIAYDQAGNATEPLRLTIGG